MTAAFNHDIYNALYTTVRDLWQRRKQVGQLHLTYEEYYDTFVPAEARQAFREAAPWMHADRYTQNWDLLPFAEPGRKILQASLTLHQLPDKSLPPMARVPGIQGDAPREVVDRIYDWAEADGDHSRDFGRVVKVLNMFNESYSRVATRYYWPTILALLGESDKTRALAKELQDLRTPAKLKPLPPGLLAACRKTAETIATVRLLPKDIETPENVEVTIAIKNGQYYEEDFSNFYGMS